MLNEMPIGIGIMSLEQKMIYYNREGEVASKMEIPKLLPEEWTEKYGIFHENGTQPYKSEELPIVMALSGQVIKEKIMILKRVDSEDVVLFVSSRPLRDKEGKIIGSLAMFQNKTEEVKLRNRLETSARLELIGRLAGGIAHDFNNMLGTVLMSANHCLDELEQDHQCRRDLEVIVKVGEKSAALTRQLLAAGRKQIMQPKIVNIAHVTQDSLKMIDSLLGGLVQLKFIQSSRVPTAYVDPVQFEQVLMNLTINARDAMPQGGVVTIETDVVEIDNNVAESMKRMKPGLYSVMSVSDRGGGISKENLKNIFHPFFSTKEKGFGLGLATVQGIVEQSGGTIWTYSEEGIGTVFKVYLPFACDTAMDVKESSDNLLSVVAHETVLLVEDDKNLQKTIERCLASKGYKVLVASSGAEAMSLVGKIKMHINVLLTDVVMPGMNGRELAIQLVNQIPHLKVIYTSGYSENVIVHHGILKEGIEFLQKPVSENDLLRKIRSVLIHDKV